MFRFISIPKDLTLIRAIFQLQYPNFHMTKHWTKVGFSHIMEKLHNSKHTNIGMETRYFNNVP